MRALVIASLTCFPLWSIWVSVTPLVYYATGDQTVAEGAGRYTMLFCFAYPTFTLGNFASAFLQSQKIVFAVLWILVVGCVINISFQYIFIVILQQGTSGVPLAYLISMILVTLFLFAYIRISKIHLNFSGLSFTMFSDWLHFLRYGAVSVLQVLIDRSIMRIVPIVVIGVILKDTQQLALAGILNAVWYVTSAVTVGYGISASVRIANLLGESNLNGAKKSTVLVVVFIFVLQCCLRMSVFSLASPLSYLFTSVEGMREQIEFGVKIVGLCVSLDTFSAIRGIATACGLQFYALLIQFTFLIIISAPLGVVLTFYVSWRAVALILIPSIGYFISSIFLLILLYCYSWDNIQNKVSLDSRLQNPNLNERQLLVSDDDPPLPSSSQDSNGGTPYPFPPLSNLHNIFRILRFLILLIIGIIIFVLVCSYVFQ
ncbi:Multidrug and toxin extrusion protein 1-like [Oopsacas minuta]|uniref:Multidrug and toxin extrusion protein 1-like n=1 Tax=Oopsacas minuta TaxID=111878 RepID=A0AAV7K9E5_9METZ|nr:Multidrug and toxin extrusion protein 1-like [Oopsacas minuta]